jgi:hypothetical protein
MSSGVPWLWLTWDSIASRGGTAQAQASPEEAFKIARISCFGAFSRLLRAFESLDVGKVLFARCGPLVLEQRSPPDHRNRVAIELEVRAVGDGLVEGYRLRDSRCRFEPEALPSGAHRRTSQSLLRQLERREGCTERG